MLNLYHSEHYVSIGTTKIKKKNSGNINTGKDVKELDLTYCWYHVKWNNCSGKLAVSSKVV